jgi:hypothetical protein
MVKITTPEDLYDKLASKIRAIHPFLQPKIVEPSGYHHNSWQN